MKLDEKDRIIISMYADNPHIVQEEIGFAIGLSQPSVAVRVRKLKENGAIETQTGVNYQALKDLAFPNRTPDWA